MKFSGRASPEFIKRLAKNNAEKFYKFNLFIKKSFYKTYAKFSPLISFETKYKNSSILFSKVVWEIFIN